MVAKHPEWVCRINNKRCRGYLCPEDHNIKSCKERIRADACNADSVDTTTPRDDSIYVSITYDPDEIKKEKQRRELKRILANGRI
jgi:hypothetical protein